MSKLHIRELSANDKDTFILVMQQSFTLHQPWVKTPQTDQEFDAYFARYKTENHRAYLTFTPDEKLVGVFNISSIERGAFQSAYLGYYVNHNFSGKGYMKNSFLLVLEKIFHELQLHRIEANIQPENQPSINLVQKLGFRKEGFSPRYLYINGEWRDHERWALTIEDWERWKSSGL